MKVTFEFDENALATALMQALVAAGGSMNVTKVGDVAVASTTAPADDAAKKKAAAEVKAKAEATAKAKAAAKAKAEATAKTAETATVGDDDDWGGDDETKTFELADVRNALQAYSAANDKAAAKAILVEVGGSAGLSTLDESKFAAVIAALAV